MISEILSYVHGEKGGNMKKLFYILLKKYSKTEKDRIKIIQTLDDQVWENYPEQTYYGNVYNHFIEFVMANPFIVRQVMLRDNQALDILKRGMGSAFDEAIKYIEKEAKP